MARSIIILGAGGNAREIRWLVSELAGAPFEFAGFVVSDPGKLTPRDSRDDIVGDFDWLVRHRDRYSALAFGIGSPEPRDRIAKQLAGVLPDIEWPTLIHPSVRYHAPTTTLGRGVALCAGVTLTVNVAIEEFTLVSIGSVICHESTIGRCGVLNPSVNVSGGVRVGERVLLGVGCQILQYLSIGDGATVGAGAVVTKDVAPGATVVGVPARPLGK